MAQPCLYTPLPYSDSIRLLKLDFDLDGDRISCSLEVIEHSHSAPAYRCLSYCWGGAADVVSIRCNGEATTITKSLHAALVQLHRNGEFGYLWADALCINQAHIAERNQQVSIMAQLYQNCSRVLVWLGSGDENTALAVDTIVNISNSAYVDDGRPRRLIKSAVESFCDEENEQGLASFDKVNFEAWQALCHFYKADWFCRLWVIQEVGQHIDVRVLRGDHIVSWEHVGSVAYILSSCWDRSIRIRPDFFRWTVISARNLTAALFAAALMWSPDTVIKSSSSDLFDILWATLVFKASDARDKVFAFSDRFDRLESGASLEVDYSKTVLQVYQQIAVYYLTHQRCAAILGGPRVTTHGNTSWPSWVPRWDAVLNRYDKPVKDGYNASLGSVLQCTVNENDPVLKIRGVHCGSVVSTTSIAEYTDSQRINSGKVSTPQDEVLSLMRLIHASVSKMSLASFMAYLASRLREAPEPNKNVYISLTHIWCNECGHQIVKAHDVYSMPIAMYSCYICDDGNYDICSTCHEKHNVRCPAPSHALKVRHSLYLRIPQQEDLQRALTSGSEIGPTDDVDSLQSAGYGWPSLFIETTMGMRGSTTHYARAGDVIAVFFGCRVPFLLRKREGGGYRLISDCYVEGLIDGEAIDMWEQGELKDEEFEIF